MENNFWFEFCLWCTWVDLKLKFNVAKFWLKICSFYGLTIKMELLVRCVVLTEKPESLAEHRKTELQSYKIYPSNFPTHHYIAYVCSTCVQYMCVCLCLYVSIRTHKGFSLLKIKQNFVHCVINKYTLC